MTNDEKMSKTRMTNDENLIIRHLIIFSDFGFLISGFSIDL